MAEPSVRPAREMSMADPPVRPVREMSMADRRYDLSVRC